MPSSHRRAAAVGAALALLVGSGVTLSGPAGAATFDVTTSADSGAGSLRAAIADAAANPGPDVIEVQDGLGPIVLTSGTLSYPAGGDLTIEGNGVTVSGNDASGVLSNGSSDAVTLRDMTITGATGNAVNTSDGDLTAERVVFEGNQRAANANSGTLTIVDSTIRANTTGGDVINTNTGPLFVTRSQIVDNAGNAGNTNSGTITITDSLIARNANRGFNTASGDVRIIRSTIADNGGRGFNAASTEMDIIESTISGHSTASNGAGVNVGSGTVRVVNSTITGNTATGAEGGGIALGTGTVLLAFATVAGNGADDAGNIRAGELRTFGSVIAEPTSGNNCSVRVTVSSGYNYSDGTCGLTEATDTQDGAPTQLGPLADNGGPTRTLLPAETSPLVDAIPADCGDGTVPGIATDQRGVTRPQRGRCDIGSVELAEEPPPTTTTTAPTTTTTPTTPTAVVATPRFTG